MKLSYYFAKLVKKIHIPAVKNSDISKKAKVCPGAHIVSSEVGKYSYIGNFSTVINSEIGSRKTALFLLSIVQRIFL